MKCFRDWSFSQACAVHSTLLVFPICLRISIASLRLLGIFPPAHRADFFWDVEGDRGRLRFMDSSAPPPVSPQPSSGVNRYSLQEFVEASAQRDRGEGVFELETPRLLELNLNGEIWTKMGSMVAYRGNVKFTREGMLDQGVGNLLKKAVSGEGASLTKAQGQGQVYLADSGKKVIIVQLQNEEIIVNGNDLLAFEPSVSYEITMMKKLGAMLAGGLFNIRLSGTGMIAFTSHYEPITLRVTPEMPVCTDPNATIAWSGTLSPELKKDISIRTFVGRGSGESIQMLFQGDGFVVIQPYEELILGAASG